jgi:O-antigen ligase
MLAAVLAVWCLLLWLHPQSALDRGSQPVRAAALVFACVTIAAYVSANRNTMSTLERNGADRGLILLVGWLGVLVLAADGITSWERLQVVLRRMVIGATSMAGIGIGQFITGLNLDSYISIPGFTVKVDFNDLLNRDGINRPSATAAHPLEFAAVLAICLPIAVHRARYAEPGARLRRWLQVALIAMALPLTVSRAALLGIAVMMLVMLPTWPKRDRRIAGALVAGGLAGLWLAVPRVVTLLYELFTQIGSSSESSSQSRIAAYSGSVPFLTHHPWFGQGFGTFMSILNFYIDDQYLTTLIETGFAGLATLLALMLTGWWAARKARRLLADPRLRDLLQSLSAAVAAAVVSFATFDALSFAIAAGVTFLTLGCVAAAWRLACGEAAHTRSG